VKGACPNRRVSVSGVEQEGRVTQCGVRSTRWIERKCACTNGNVATAISVGNEGTRSDGYILTAGGVAVERVRASGHVVGTRGVAQQRGHTQSGIAAGRIVV